MTATDAQIKDWKNRHGDVYLVEVPIDDEGSEMIPGYFKKPDLNTLSASGKFANEDPVKAGSILLENCWLGGDERIKTVDELKMSAITQVGKLFKVREASLKKL